MSNLNEDLNDKTQFTYLEPLDIKTEVLCLNSIFKMSTDYLKEYSTTLEEDLILQRRTELNMTINQRNCLKMREGEKVILEYFRDFAQYCIALFDINDTKDIKKKIKKDHHNKLFPYEIYVNDVLLNLVKSNSFKDI